MSGIPEKYSDIGLMITLQRITHDVVDTLGYVGALVATYEEGGALPIRAVYIDPQVASVAQVRQWEERLSKLIRQPVSLSDPDIARVYVHDATYADNLSVKAVQARQAIVSDDLFDLFTPIIPKMTKPIVNAVIQRMLKIKQVIAVPFFTEAFNNDDPMVVGNLFAATTNEAGFTRQEQDILQAFGRQAAAAIWNVRLYRKAEERQKIAEVFAKMAFGAAANVHALSNHIGAFRVYFQMLSRTSDPERLQHLLGSSDRYLKRLNQAADILSNLHEPWGLRPDEPVSVNHALQRALSKVTTRLNLDERVAVHLSLGENLPFVETSYDMLVEGFRILITRSMEAILTSGAGGTAELVETMVMPEGAPDLETAVTPLGNLRITTMAVDALSVIITITHDAPTLSVESVKALFELQWPPAKKGFGLFWLKDYVEGLDGDIRVDSVVGKGTTFYVQLPASDNLPK